MSVFVDSSFWFAAMVARDSNNAKAKAILKAEREHVTTDHVVVETWLLLNSRYHRAAAERFWERVRRSGAHVEIANAADLEAAWAIGASYPDQEFLSLIARASRSWNASGSRGQQVLTVTLQFTGMAAAATKRSMCYASAAITVGRGA